MYSKAYNFSQVTAISEAKVHPKARALTLLGVPTMDEGTEDSFTGDANAAC